MSAPNLGSVSVHFFLPLNQKYIFVSLHALKLFAKKLNILSIMTW